MMEKIDPLAAKGLWPRISMVTPSYNQGRYVEQTLRSVLEQSYPAHEYLVVDGGSSDASAAIIERYAPRLTWWVSERDRGQSHAINKGFTRATGDVLGWINSDDYLAPDALNRVAQMVREHPNAVAWVGACVVEDAEGRCLRVEKPRITAAEGFGDWHRQGYLVQPACFFRADLFRELGGLDERLHYVMDVDLWLRLRQRGEFAACEDVLAHARTYPQAKTRRDSALREAELIAVNVLREYPQLARARLIAYSERRLLGANRRLAAYDDRLREATRELRRLRNPLHYARWLFRLARNALRQRAVARLKEHGDDIGQ